MLDEKDEKKIKIIEELTKAVVESIVSTPMNNINKYFGSMVEGKGVYVFQKNGGGYSKK